MKLRVAPARLTALPATVGMTAVEPAILSTTRLRGRAGVARRGRIIQRDGFTCRLCGQVSAPDGLRVDHITPLAMGGSDDDDDNLRALCVPCHDRVTREEFGQRPRRP